MGELSTREWATLVWLGALLGLALANRGGGRRVLKDLLRMLLGWKVLVPIVAFAVWLVGAVHLAWRLGAWDSRLTKDTVVWLAIAGFGLLFATTEAAKPGFLRKALIGAAGLVVIMQYVLNLHTFHIAIELALQGLIAILVMMSVYGHHRQEYISVARFCDGVLAVTGAVVVAATVRGLLHEWGTLDTEVTLLGLVLPIWLTVAALPFIYAFALVMNYETLMLRLRWKRGAGLPWAVRLAVYTTLGLRLRAIDGLPRHPETWHAVGHASGYREARRVLRRYVRSRRRSPEGGTGDQL